jgi:hypothetical protein
VDAGLEAGTAGGSGKYVAAGSFTNPEGAKSARLGDPGDEFRTRKLTGDEMRRYRA